jgi:hypothetical protein
LLAAAESTACGEAARERIAVLEQEAEEAATEHQQAIAAAAAGLEQVRADAEAKLQEAQQTAAQQLEEVQQQHVAEVSRLQEEQAAAQASRPSIRSVYGSPFAGLYLDTEAANTLHHSRLACLACFEAA